MELFKFDNKEHLIELARRIRQDATNKEDLMMEFFDGFYIKGNASKIFVNACLQLMFDSYKVSREKDIRKDLFFTTSYEKGMPEEYSTKVLRALLRDKDLFMPEISIPFILDRVKSQFYRLAIIGNDIVTVQHGLLGYIDTYLNDKRYRDIIDKDVYNDTDTPWEIDRKIKNVAKLFESGDIFIDPLTYYFTSGVKANLAQVQTFAVTYGMMPDAVNTYIAHEPIRHPLINGLRKKQDIMHMDQMGIKARFVGKNDIKEGGTVFKQVISALLPARLNSADTREVINDCGTHRTWKIKIEKESELIFYRGKNYCDDNGNIIGYVDYDRKDLIGKEINIRSIAFCKGDHICLDCFGHFNKFMRDNKIHYNNYITYIIDDVAKIVQGVISIKHFIVAIIKAILVSFGDIKDMDLEKFIETTPYIKKMVFDRIYFNKKYKVELKHIPTKTAANGLPIRYKNELWVDGKLFETGQNIVECEDGSYKIDIPNDSVIANAERFYELIGGQNNDFFKENAEYIKTLDFEGMVKFLFKFMKERIKLDHFIQYETLIYILLRDGEDSSKRATEDSKTFNYVNVRSDITSPSKSSNIGIGMVHGYIKKVFKLTKQNATPVETDVFYNSITEGRDTAKGSLYTEFNDILNGYFTKDMMMNDFNGVLDDEELATIEGESYES